MFTTGAYNTDMHVNMFNYLSASSHARATREPRANARWHSFVSASVYLSLISLEAYDMCANVLTWVDTHDVIERAGRAGLRKQTQQHKNTKKHTAVCVDAHARSHAI